MTQAYSNPKRESSPYSLPDVEVFWVNAGEWGYDPNGERCDCSTEDDPGHPEVEPCEAGYYWWHCLPGCLPDSDPHGPFETEELALANMREENESWDDFEPNTYGGD
jgi:hypothetical protein